jgi:hypothetical protein
MLSAEFAVIATPSGAAGGAAKVIAAVKKENAKPMAESENRISCKTSNASADPLPTLTTNRIILEAMKKQKIIKTV